MLEGDEDIEGDGMLLTTRNQKLCIPEYGHRIQLVNWLILIDKPRAPITVLRDKHVPVWAELSSGQNQAHMK